MDEFRESGLFRKFWIVTAISFLVTASAYVWIPSIRIPLLRENSFLESLTALFFFLVVILGTKTLLEKRSKKYPMIFWIIPLLGLLGFLEETSFGHRFLDYNRPTIQGVKMDAVHDFLRVFIAMFKSGDNGLLIAITAAGLGLLAACLWLWLRKCGFRSILKQIDASPALKFTGLCIGFLLLAGVLDLDVFTHHFSWFLEEFLETTAGLSLVFSCFSLRNELSYRSEENEV